MKWEFDSTRRYQGWFKIMDTWIPIENIHSMEVIEDNREYRGGQWRIFFRFHHGGGTWADGFSSKEEAHSYIRDMLELASNDSAG